MLSFCGIDVSKDRLDVMVLPGRQSFAVRNDAAGWAELIARLRGLTIAAIGLEASGGYERGAIRTLLAAGLPACQVNPFKLRQFARASGVLARLLEDAMLQRLSRRRIAKLVADIESLDAHLVEIVDTDAALAHRYRLLTSMPGVGLVLACTLIALLPELGVMSRKQVAALVGVAPYAFESGKFKGRRCIWGGRAPVREVLYMAAMSAGNWNPVLKQFRKRLQGAGKLPKVIIVAVMRKMITMLNAMVRDDVAWADHLHGRRTVPTAC